MSTAVKIRPCDLCGTDRHDRYHTLIEQDGKYRAAVRCVDKEQCWIREQAETARDV